MCTHHNLCLKLENDLVQLLDQPAGCVHAKRLSARINIRSHETRIAQERTGHASKCTCTYLQAHCPWLCMIVRDSTAKRTCVRKRIVRFALYSSVSSGHDTEGSRLRK
eukprot:2905579-Pleurochrysis_carterae.AAC.1